MKKWAYLFLFGLLVLVSACGTTGRHAARKTAAVSEKDPLTYEQRRKYDYYFLEALRMKHKAIMMRPLNFTSIVWIFILSRQRPVMK